MCALIRLCPIALAMLMLACAPQAHAQEIVLTADAPAGLNAVSAGPPAALPPPENVRLEAAESAYQWKTLGRDISSAKWQVLGLTAAITATRVTTLVKHPSRFRFTSEGWFGRNTESLGMDKLHHAYKTYVIADVLQTMIARKTGEKKAAALSGAAIGLGLMTYGELFDGFSKGHGWSNEDMVVHLAGAGFALARNAVPGLRDKLDFRMEMRPSSRGEALELNNQLDDRKYLLAGQLSGFKRFEKSPLRFVEVHLGYYARGFTDIERARGDPVRRKIYVGVGLNMQQLLFGKNKPKSRGWRLAHGALDYLQIPYVVQELN